MNEIRPESRLYLASRSPRRRELLTQVGIRFDLLMLRGVPRLDDAVDETWLPGEPPEIYVQRVAHAKARFGMTLLAQRRLPPGLVLAADTTLDLDGEVIGKPRDEEDAINILQRLSGRSHRVLTAVALAKPQAIEPLLRQTLSINEVRFRPLDEQEIRRYAYSGEPMDKAGAYGIQGRAAMFIETICGSHSGIVGLPLNETVLLLRAFGYPI
jgi:septum formation protein